jgi:pimeloyl-ACP methyl ester carboxylesterase
MQAHADVAGDDMTATRPLFHRKAGHGLPVVFLAGSPAPWDVLRGFAAALVATHTCIEIAVPGTEPAGATIPVSFDESTTQVEHTLRYLGLARCAFVGFSSGAY